MSADGSARKRRVLSLVALVIIGVALSAGLSFIEQRTHARILRNQQAWIQQRLDLLIPPALHDNDLLDDRVAVISPDLLGTKRPVDVYRARKGGAPVAIAIHTVAPDGYRGPIELLIGIDTAGKLLGVQVIRHQETPGLGDAFEHRDRGWLTHFRGLSLDAPPQQRWSVRKDGGEFDAFTGATITPRAIVKAVRRALEYHAANRERIYSLPSSAPEHDS